MEFVSDVSESQILVSGDPKEVAQPMKEFHSGYLPGLLSRLENSTISGTCTGFTTESGITIDDSGAVEIRRG